MKLSKAQADLILAMQAGAELIREGDEPARRYRLTAAVAPDVSHRYCTPQADALLRLGLIRIAEERGGDWAIAAVLTDAGRAWTST